MSRPVRDDDDDLLDVPLDGDLGESEAVGVDDAEELLLGELEDGPEDVGLDVEVLGSSDALLALSDLTQDEEESDLDEAPIEIEADVDADGDEHGWTEDTEGSDEPWEDELPEELDQHFERDAGEEGVDDPLLDGLPEDHELPPVEHDEEEEAEQELGADESDELPPDIRQDR